MNGGDLTRSTFRANCATSGSNPWNLGKSGTARSTQNGSGLSSNRTGRPGGSSGSPGAA